MKTKLILVIDDESAVRSIIVAVLRRCGWTNVLEAANGREGIEMIKEHNPDLVITDLTMPGMRGEEVLRWISREHKPAFPAIKTIALSGDGLQVESVVKAAGCDVFLDKPFQIDQLKMAVDALLA